MSARPSSKQILAVAIMAALAVTIVNEIPALRGFLREPWYQRWLFPFLWGAAVPFALIATWATVSGVASLVRAIGAAPASSFDNLGEYFLIGMAIGALLSLASSRR